MAEASGHELAPGSELAGYRIDGVLGRGGMGVVYGAFDLGLERKVAVKMLAPELADDVEFRERFHRESRLAASLDHPAIVPIYEAGEIEGHLYIAMRLVDGSDLKTLLRAEGNLEPERALSLLSHVAEALDTAHERGLIHRDVKPSNVLINSRGHSYLADFGLSRRLADPKQRSSNLPSLGTSDYASPEQIRGDEPVPESDVYSLACLLYECLSGETPFPRPTELATVFAHLEEEPPTFPGLDRVLAKALAKEPDNRYHSCRDLVDDARSALGVHGPRPRRRLRAAAGVLVLVGLAITLALAFITGPNTAQANALAQQSVAESSDPQAALRLAVKAAKTAHTSASESALRVALASDQLIRTIPTGKSGKDAIFSPDGRQVLTIGNKLMIWDAASGRLLYDLDGHRLAGSPVFGTAEFSPNGKEVVALGTAAVGRSGSTEEDGDVAILWDPAKHRWYRWFSGGGVSDVSFSPDGASVAVGEIKRYGPAEATQIRDVATGRVMWRLRAGRNVIVSPAHFAQDGRYIVAITRSRDLSYAIRTWDARNGRTVRVRVLGGKYPINATVFSPDGARVLTSDKDSWHRSTPSEIWDVASGHLLRRPNLPITSAFSFSQNGKRLLGLSEAGSVEIWNATSGRRIRVLRVALHYTQGLGGGVDGTASFNPSATRVITAFNSDGSAASWDVTSGRRLQVLRNDTGDIRRASFSPDGDEVVTVGDSGTQIWAVANTTAAPYHAARMGHRPMLPLDEPAAFDAAVRRIVHSLHGRLVVASCAKANLLLTIGPSGAGQLWDTANGHQLHVLPHALPPSWSKSGYVAGWAVFSPDGKLVIVETRGSTYIRPHAKMWDTGEGHLLRRQLGQFDQPRFSPTGTRFLLSALFGDTQSTYLFDTATARLLKLFPDVYSRDDSIFSPDGTEVLEDDTDGLTRAWDADNGQLLRTYQGETPRFAPDAKEVMTSTDTTIRVWDAASARVLQTLELSKVLRLAREGGALALSFSPTGKGVLVGHRRFWPCRVCGVSFQQLLTSAEQRLAANS